MTPIDTRQEQDARACATHQEAAMVYVRRESAS